MFASAKRTENLIGIADQRAEYCKVLFGAISFDPAQDLHIGLAQHFFRLGFEHFRNCGNPVP